jgi:polar amino acid transport system substrate-binding protein
MYKRLAAALLLLVSVSLQVYADEGRVRLTNGEWAPFLSASLPHHGAASHIVVEAFGAVGVEVEYGFFPWKRSFMLAQRGHWNGSVVWVHTPERSRDFLFSEVVITDAEYLFHLKSNQLQWQTLDDLVGMKLGGTLHTTYPVFKPMERQGLLRIERAGTYAELFQRLLKRRIDAIPQVSIVGNYLARTTLTPEELAQITYSPTVIQKREYRLMLSRERPESEQLLELFNRGLKEIRENGTYDRIMKQLSEGYYDS